MSLPTQEFVWLYTGELSCKEGGNEMKWNAGELPGGSNNFSCRLMLRGNRDKLQLDGLLISSSTNLTFFNDTCYYMANES